MRERLLPPMPRDGWWGWGGPLAVTGTLTIRSGHDYELEGLAAARPEATPELAKAVEFLGPADPQGRRAYSLAGTF